METCARCGRTYPPDQTFCASCGLALPGMRGLAGAVQTDPAVSHIEFLLAQLDEWVQQGWVAPEQARRLHDIYQERRRWPPSGPPPASTPVEALPDAPPSPPSPLTAFFQESNLSFWHLIGALLLLAELVGLVRWTWGSVGKYLVFALMLGLTGALSVWPVTGAAALEVLLLERRALPWAHLHAGWEPNYGLGLFVLSLLGLLLGDRLTSRESEGRDWTRAALVVAAGTALLQWGYALSGLLPLSPLGLLGGGALFAGGIGLVRQSPRAADCAAGLTGGFYLTLVLGRFAPSGPMVDPVREALAAGGLLALALTPTFVAAWQAGASPLHALLLLTECVAALFCGIAARIKVFAGAGLAFLVALLRETRGLVGHIHWAVYATALGLAILGSALFFEKRGDEARRWAQAAQEKLREWD